VVINFYVGNSLTSLRLTFFKMALSWNRQMRFGFIHVFIMWGLHF